MVAQKKLEKLQEKFMGCINRNDIEGLRTHLKNGVDPNFGPNHVGYYVRLNDLPPLFASACLFQPEIVQLLLDYGVDPTRNLTEGSDFDEKTPKSLLPTPHNCLEYFVDHMSSIDNVMSSPHPSYYKKNPVQSEVVLQIYKSLRGCIELSDSLWQKMSTSKGAFLMMFVAWEQQQMLQNAVSDCEGVVSHRRM